MLRPRLRIPRLSQLVRPAVAASSSSAPSLRRSIHHIPPLSHDFKDGVPGLLSAGGFDMAWNQYMALMMEKLNNLTAGDEKQQTDILSVILKTARDPSEARTFNVASAAHNNHWFFRRLHPNPGPMPSDLKAALEESFSSIESLRKEFVNTAEGMFGPGFIWLVKLDPKHAPGSGQTNPFRIVTTYLAGSPYAGAHWRRQGVDRNTVSADAEKAGPLSGSQWPEFKRGSVDVEVRKENVAPGGINVIPLLCLNTWEHVWLMDYGMGVGGVGGKLNFVENWWNVIDWEGVASDANIKRPALQQ
ncbi:superoxide dismutase [Coniochaeta sp. 2T2.1]|nr:superoxide dismutase [Coniochaeta sp. 2T2.1]